MVSPATAGKPHPTHDVRCVRCGRLLARITSGAGLVEAVCRSCKAVTVQRLTTSG